MGGGSRRVFNNQAWCSSALGSSCERSTKANTLSRNLFLDYIMNKEMLNIARLTFCLSVVLSVFRFVGAKEDVIVESSAGVASFLRQCEFTTRPSGGFTEGTYMTVQEEPNDCKKRIVYMKIDEFGRVYRRTDRASLSGGRVRYSTTLCRPEGTWVIYPSKAARIDEAQSHASRNALSVLEGLKTSPSVDSKDSFEMSKASSGGREFVVIHRDLADETIDHMEELAKKERAERLSNSGIVERVASMVLQQGPDISTLVPAKIEYWVNDSREIEIMREYGKNGDLIRESDLLMGEMVPMESEVEALDWFLVPKGIKKQFPRTMSEYHEFIKEGSRSSVPVDEFQHPYILFGEGCLGGK